MAKKYDEDPGDDGRTIADMNVEGMPWYVSGDENRNTADSGKGHEQLTDEQFKMYRFAALKAGLLVALVFGTVFFLFILFCDFVWFQ